REGLVALLRRELATALPPTDYGVVGLVLVVLALLLSGGRRVRHLRYLDGDPVVLRFCGLRHLPTIRTLGRWLGAFRVRHLPARHPRLPRARGGRVRDQGAVSSVARPEGARAANAALVPRGRRGELRRASRRGRLLGAGVPDRALPPPGLA